MSVLNHNAESSSPGSGFGLWTLDKSLYSAKRDGLVGRREGVLPVLFACAKCPLAINNSGFFFQSSLGSLDPVKML